MWERGLQNVNGPALTGFAFYSLRDEKNRFSLPKKRRENCHFGVCFSQSGMKTAGQKPGSVKNPSHAWPSQKGMTIGQKVGLSRSPELRRKAVFFFQPKKVGTFHALQQDIPQKIGAKNRFSYRFPLLQKKKKREKRIGLVFNL